MKSRILYGLSTRQASSFSMCGRFWWKGLRYVYFRKVLTSGFRPNIRLNGSPKKADHLDGSKLSKGSSTPGQHCQQQQTHPHLLQQRSVIQQQQNHKQQRQELSLRVLKSTMKFRDIARLVWRAVSAARRRPSTTAPTVANRPVGGSQSPLQAGIGPKLTRLEPKLSPEAKHSPANHDMRSMEMTDFEHGKSLHKEGHLSGSEDHKKNTCNTDEKTNIATDADTSKPKVPPTPTPVTKPTSERREARMSEGVIVYARRLPQLLTGMVSSLGWSPPHPGELKMGPELRTAAQKPLEVDDHVVAAATPQTNVAPQNKQPVPPPSPADAAAIAAAAAAEAEAAKVIEALSLDALQGQQQQEKTPQSAPSWKRQSSMWATHEAATSRTRYLMRAVATANTLMSQMTRVQDFCKHLVDNPQAKNLAVKERAIPLMLRLRTITHDPEMMGYINEALALLGYISPLRGQGIRILCIDGGGTRGIMALEILRQFEQITCQPVHRLFDFMCGVSTGAILSVLLGAMKASMDECEELYMRTSCEIFSQNTWLGTGKLVLNHAFYDTDAWVKVLQKNIGEIPLIHTARDPECPKIAAVSTIVNEPRLRAFLFRNYEYPHRHQSEFPGSNSPQLWEAIRASAAAPGYFEEYKLGDYVHQDGGILTNNPSALAIHECRHLWPNKPIQCVISLGNGRYEPQVPSNVSMSSLKTKLLKIVDSATDTEGVHMILNDLLPPKRYYRFNPYLSDSFSLDEIRPEKFKQLQNDARMYIRKNEHKIREAAVQLLEPKSKMQQIKDTVKEKVMTYM